jgi:hypothetical protein
LPAAISPVKVPLSPHCWRRFIVVNKS